MTKKIVILLFIFLGVVNTKFAAPRDLVDEATALLEELSDIVHGEIASAHVDLDNSITEFGTNSANTAENAGVAIQQESENINTRLNSLKDLGNSASVDISLCTNTSEEVLSQLPSQYRNQMTDCIATNDNESNKIGDDAKYTVDVLINRVLQLEFQFNQCGQDLLCILPLITEIELDKIRLPQSIKTEVQAAESFWTTLRQSVKNCGDYNVSGYATNANSILRYVAACVSTVIG